MKLVLSNTKTHLPNIASLRFGDVFKEITGSGEVFMKIETHNFSGTEHLPAVNLRTGHVAWFPPTTLVLHLPTFIGYEYPTDI